MAQQPTVPGESSTPAAERSVSSGSRLGPYQITDAIGARGMGTVYRAHDTRLHGDVAVKVLPNGFANNHELAQTPDMLDSRYDGLKSGNVKPVSRDELVAQFTEPTLAGQDRVHDP